METVNAIPKWFWFALGVVVIATIGAIMYCNRKQQQTASEIASSINNQTSSSAIRGDENQNVFDLIPSLQNAVMA